MPLTTNEYLMIGVGCVSLIISLLLRQKLPSFFKKPVKKNDENYYHFIFTTVKNAECREHMNMRQSCSDTCSFEYLQKITRFLASANFTISLCMYTACLETIAEELVAAHKRGVHVRVITDWEMTRTNKHILSLCKNAGIPMKSQNEKLTSMMHHKFCLVDEHHSKGAKVFFGSLNLTMQGLCGNFENVMFTNDQEFVSRYSDEFEYLWNVLDICEPCVS